MFLLTFVVFPYHSSVEFLTKWYSLLFRIDVSKDCVYALISFFLFALLGGLSDAKHDIEFSTYELEYGVLFSLPCVVHSFVSDFELFSVIQGTLFGHW